MNLANKLTILRLILIVPFIIFFKFQFVFYPFVFLSFIIFVIASVTDYFDGKIARQTGTITDFGKVFDPIADKLLTFAPIVILHSKHLVPTWIVFILLLREIFVTALRVHSNRVIPASNIAKYKTMVMLCALAIIILYPSSRILNSVLLMPAVVLSLISIYDYYKEVS